MWTIASPEPYNTDAAEVLDSIDNAPTVDAAPVVHSSWEISIGGNGWNEWSICKCKNCGREYKNFDNENYCPNCGAKMDGDEK